MAIRRPRSYLPIALAVAASLTACDRATGPGAGETLAGKITIDGSATVIPLTQAMADAFRGLNPTVQFAIQLSGTGGGFQTFCSGETDIEDASRPINAAESENAKPGTFNTSKSRSPLTASLCS